MTNWNTIIETVTNILFVLGSILWLGVAAVETEPYVTAGSFTPEAYWMALGVISVFAMMVLIPAFTLMVLTALVAVVMGNDLDELEEVDGDTDD